MRSAAGQATATARLVLALKTAIAASVAWYLAPLVPFADADYSYYAPLGVLVSMHPTVADSVRSGLFALLGLACGIGLGLGGLAIIAAGAPGIVALALVVGVGVALGGVRALEAGRDWIAIAGLFVLLLGGRDADEFSLSYLATMGFGVVVGIAANYLVLPPLFVREAGGRLSDLRGGVVALLTRIAEMVDAGELDAAELDGDADALAVLVDEVSGDVRDADRSRRGNPRARRTGEASEQNSRRWWALERTAFFARDIADVVARNPELVERRGDSEVFATALRSTAEAVAVPPGDPHAESAVADAVAAVERYTARTGAGMTPASAAAASLGRIAELSRPFSE